MNKKLNIRTKNTISTRIFNGGVAIVPYSAEVYVYSPEGELLVDAEVATIGADGTVSYILEDISDWEKGENYLVEWEYYGTSGGDMAYASDLYDVVGFTFGPEEIGPDELVKFAPYLEEVREVLNATATAGTTTTMTDSAIRETGSFTFKGAVARFRSGTNNGLSRLITNYANGVFTFDTALPVAVASGDRAYIQRGYADEIAQALQEVKIDLYGLGINPENIIDINQIKMTVLTRAARNIVFTRIKSPDDSWKMRFDILDTQYNKTLEALKLKLDTVGDGIIDSTSSMSQPRAYR